MLTFAVYRDGQLVESIDLSGAYVLGSDDVPLRADISSKNGLIMCRKRAAGPAGLAILWDIPKVGRVLVETVRLLERKQPYILQTELARGRLMRVSQKLEDWGLNDYEGAEAGKEQLDAAREALIKSLQADTPAEAAALGDESLSLSVQASEELACLHAQAFLDRRKQSGGFSRRVFGCSLQFEPPTADYRKRLVSAFDFAAIPFVWREIESSEQNFNWKPLDSLIETLAKLRIPMKGSALLSFNESTVPDWLYIWEHDFDTIRDLAFEHARRVINRYGQYIQTWDVISGIHANNCFTFSFEQLMELTRMTAALTKQIAPRSATIIDLVAPWGEYYARNQRTIPPLLYADMAVQSGINFDAFGLQFLFGPEIDGMFVRDMFQVSSLLDVFAKLGKPLHITAAQVPSDTKPDQQSERKDGPISLNGGIWREPWSEQVQSEWLQRFMDIALSKPYVESITWRGLADHPNLPVPHGGLLRSDLKPKPAYGRLKKIRAQIQASTQKDSTDAAALGSVSS